MSVRKIRPAVMRPDTCVLAPAASPVAVEERVASTVSSLEEPAADVCRTQGDQLLVRIDLIMVACCIRPGYTEAFTNRNEDHTNCTRKEEWNCRNVHLRKARCRETCGDAYQQC